MSKTATRLDRFVPPVLFLITIISAHKDRKHRLCFSEPCGNDYRPIFLPTWDTADLFFASSTNSSFEHIEKHRRIVARSFSAKRQLLQFDSTAILISSADRREGLLLTKGCAVSLTTTISRGCSVIAETVPYYYIDQTTR